MFTAVLPFNMCGIYCSVFLAQNQNKQQINEKLHQILLNRGPNSFNLLHIDNLLFGGYVLWQQGQNLCPQPQQFKHITLLLNGDIFSDDYQCNKSQSDTSWLTECIAECKHEQELCIFFRKLQGPYSIIFYDNDKKILYFARDSLGRNSLLLEKTMQQELRVLSTSYFDKSENKTTIELPPLGLYKFNITLAEWSVFPFDVTLEQEKANIQQLQEFLQCQLSIQSNSISPEWLHLNNVPQYDFDFYEMYEKNADMDFMQFYDFCMNQMEIKQALIQFDNLLRHSMQQRIQNTTTLCSQCLKHAVTSCKHCKIAILFSGGIDCSILALLADGFVSSNEPIDLLNVAFEQLHKEGAAKYEAPDRETALHSLQELKRLCPNRQWNFVQIDVSREELHAITSSQLKHLIYPLSTVLDESIGCAFWFASRGKGLIQQCTDYSTTSRVIIVGSGADELFGGYIRHRNAYRRCQGSMAEKQAAVLQELEMDWLRIPSRNLARDDRIIADNGKTSRAAYIEESVVQFVRSLKPQQRSCYSMPEGVGDKLFLRLYGFSMGLRQATFFKKRAIQFGSRIANKNQAAQDSSEYLKF